MLLYSLSLHDALPIFRDAIHVERAITAVGEHRSDLDAWHLQMREERIGLNQPSVVALPSVRGVVLGTWKWDRRGCHLAEGAQRAVPVVEHQVAGGQLLDEPATPKRGPTGSRAGP